MDCVSEVLFCEPEHNTPLRLARSTPSALRFPRHIIFWSILFAAVSASSIKPTFGASMPSTGRVDSSASVGTSGGKSVSSTNPGLCSDGALCNTSAGGKASLFPGPFVAKLPLSFKSCWERVFEHAEVDARINRHVTTWTNSDGLKRGIIFLSAFLNCADNDSVFSSTVQLNAASEKPGLGSICCTIKMQLTPPQGIRDNWHWPC
jgi:hypothetical protein